MYVYGASVWQSPRFGTQLPVHERSPISVNGERYRDLLACGSLSFSVVHVVSIKLTRSVWNSAGHVVALTHSVQNFGLGQTHIHT